VKGSTRNTNRSNRAAQKTALRRALDPLLPALLAIGGAAGLMAKPAAAIELGQLQIDSSLGQPLSASIAYALNPNEELYSYCISLRPGTDTGVPSLTRAKLTLTGNRIVLTGSKPINEPLLAMRVAVNCPYTVRLARDYTVMINPAGTATVTAPAGLSLPAASPSTLQAAPSPAPVTTSESATATVASRIEQPHAQTASSGPGQPIYLGDNYRVQSGDTLSNIASRIDGRPIRLLSAVDAIYLANPDAFVAGDKNQLMAGSVLAIPAMQADDLIATANAPAEAADVAPITRQTYETGNATESGAATSTYQAYESNGNLWAEEEATTDDSFAVYEENTTYEAEATAGEAAPAASADTAYQDDTSVLTSGDLTPVAAPDQAAQSPEASEVTAVRPGDVFAGADSTIEAPTEPASAEPETAIVVATPVSADTTVKNVPVAKALDSATANSWSWLAWGGGGVLALFLGLLVFGRKLRGLFGDDAAERVEPVLEDDNEITQQSRNLSEVDFPLDDVAEQDHAVELDADLGDGIGLADKATPHIAFAETTDLDAAIAATADLDSNIELDADLGAGTGLQEGTDLDVAQDFGFSATGENATPMDLELPVEPDVEPEKLPTAVIPPHLGQPETILDAEVPPVENDDDSQYDLSMIVDATKQPLGEAGATSMNLMAVQLDAKQQSHDDSAYTLSKEIDFKVLEQDYEEELTQTQAVNEEIARAAVELAQRMEAQDDEEVLDLTVEMPGQDKVPAVNDDLISDADATGLNEALTIEEDVTVKAELDADTVDSKNLAS
jgi:phage tail protein X